MKQIQRTEATSFCITNERAQNVSDVSVDIFVFIDETGADCRTALCKHQYSVKCKTIHFGEGREFKAIQVFKLAEIKGNLQQIFLLNSAATHSHSQTSQAAGHYRMEKTFRGM